MAKKKNVIDLRKITTKKNERVSVCIDNNVNIYLYKDIITMRKLDSILSKPEEEQTIDDIISAVKVLTDDDGFKAIEAMRLDVDVFVELATALLGVITGQMAELADDETDDSDK